MQRVIVKCENCKKDYEITKETLKKKKTNYCRKCYSKSTQKGIKRPQFSENNSKRWKGGEYISSDGYIMVKITDNYIDSGRQLYKRKHILIYEKYLGRELITQKGGGGEQIHHIDGNKVNNSIDNLILCSDVKEHRLIHDSLEKIAFELVKTGLIKFNKKEKKYYI